MNNLGHVFFAAIFWLVAVVLMVIAINKPDVQVSEVQPKIKISPGMISNDNGVMQERPIIHIFARAGEDLQAGDIVTLGVYDSKKEFPIATSKSLKNINDYYCTVLEDSKKGELVNTILSVSRNKPTKTKTYSFPDVNGIITGVDTSNLKICPECSYTLKDTGRGTSTLSYCEPGTKDTNIHTTIWECSNFKCNFEIEIRDGE